jgi:hypothetical protein
MASRTLCLDVASDLSEPEHFVTLTVMRFSLTKVVGVIPIWKPRPHLPYSSNVWALQTVTAKADGRGIFRDRLR